MSKRHGEGVPVESDDAEKIRVPIRLTEEQRRRLRVLSVQRGEAMEYLAGEWVADRLAEEEHKQSRKG